MNDQDAGYHRPARLMHWIIAGAVLVMIPAGLVMTQDGLTRPVQDALFLLHKNLGVILIPLIALRVAYRLRHPAPPLPASVPGWQRAVARLTHLLLYAALIVMPLSGLTRVMAGGFPIELWEMLGGSRWSGRSQGIADIAKALHRTTGFILIALVVLHMAAALKHALTPRDRVWSRMWPPAAGR